MRDTTPSVPPMYIRTPLLLPLLALCCVVTPAAVPAFAADVAGTVVSAMPGAFGKRGDRQVPLKVMAAILY